MPNYIVTVGGGHRSFRAAGTKSIEASAEASVIGAGKSTAHQPAGQVDPVSGVPDTDQMVGSTRLRAVLY